MGELRRLDCGGSPPLPNAAAAYLATLSGPEQRNTQRAYRSTLRALTAEFAPPGTPFPIAELDTEAAVERLTAWFGDRWNPRAAATFNFNDLTKPLAHPTSPTPTSSPKPPAGNCTT
jgi:hypothetical protein